VPSSFACICKALALLLKDAFSLDLVEYFDFLLALVALRKRIWLPLYMAFCPFLYSFL
jgi:hypothetical protein